MSISRSGFALVDVLAIVAAGLVLGPTLVPAVSKPQELARRQKDALQIGRLAAGFNLFANDHNGWYPLPGELDLADATVRGPLRESKNYTGNIMSLLIFNGYVTPGMMVSPAETATNLVAVSHNYQYRNPTLAVRPADALWDPAFAGTPGEQRPRRTVGNQSYAHQMLFGARRSQWRNTQTSLKPLVGNRGPLYARLDSAPRPANGGWTPIELAPGLSSTTLMIHGPRNTWEGNIGFNDGSVQYTERPDPIKVQYQHFGVPSSAPDNIFVNESDEVGGDSAEWEIMRGRNTYMRPIRSVAGGGSNITALVWRD